MKIELELYGEERIPDAIKILDALTELFKTLDLKYALTVNLEAETITNLRPLFDIAPKKYKVVCTKNDMHFAIENATLEDAQKYKNNQEAAGWTCKLTPI